jgi:structural maintenance of chromosome 4
MVVDTVEAGQQCIEYLRKNNVGRANFIVLDRLPERDLTPISTPENAPRLFDLVKPKDPRFGAAFYSVLHDTIVAKDLTQANRVAYGAKRWRVVTLEGGLIDKSGTMTGGGTKVSRGGMSDKLVADMSKETVVKLEKDRDVLEAEYAQFRTEQTEWEKKVATLEKRGPELEMQQSKLSLEISALGKAMDDAQKQLTELKYSPSKSVLILDHKLSMQRLIRNRYPPSNQRFQNYKVTWINFMQKQRELKMKLKRCKRKSWKSVGSSFEVKKPKSMILEIKSLL